MPDHELVPAEGMPVEGDFGAELVATPWLPAPGSIETLDDSEVKKFYLQASGLSNKYGVLGVCCDVSCGFALIELKKRFGHGEWEKFLGENGKAVRTARRQMRAASYAKQFELTEQEIGQFSSTNSLVQTCTDREKRSIAEIAGNENDKTASVADLSNATQDKSEPHFEVSNSDQAPTVPEAKPEKVWPQPQPIPQDVLDSDKRYHDFHARMDRQREEREERLWAGFSVEEDATQRYNRLMKLEGDLEPPPPIYNHDLDEDTDWFTFPPDEAEATKLRRKNYYNLRLIGYRDRLLARAILLWREVRFQGLDCRPDSEKLLPDASKLAAELEVTVSRLIDRVLAQPEWDHPATTERVAEHRKSLGLSPAKVLTGTPS